MKKTVLPESTPPDQPKTEPAQKPSTSLFSIPDWFLRFLARCIDLIVFALMLGYVGAYQLFPHTVVGRLTYVFAATLVWAFVEANLLSSLGTTPGKWLLGIRVITYQGNRLSLLEAFRRSIGLWWHGLGAGIVPVMLVTMIICCFRMMKHRPMTWDISGRFFVIRDVRGYFVIFVALAIVFLGCRLLFF